MKEIEINMEEYKEFGVGFAGAGGWGTTLANVLAENGFKVVLWAYEKDTVDEINLSHTNSKFLPNAQLHQNIKATNNINDLDKCKLIVSTIPTQHIRKTITGLGLSLKNKYIINGSKGLEIGTIYRISEIFEEVIGMNCNNYAVLSGPSHAEELINKMPTAVVVASRNNFLSKLTQELFSNDYFRLYSSKDVKGTELGAALKNVMALASGMVDGFGFGDNTVSALITRGLAEIKRLGIALGADEMTFAGLSGMGDLIATCMSKHSRNRQAGIKFAQGKSLEQILNETPMVAEGVPTTKAAYELSVKYDIEMPIVKEIYEVIYNNADPKDSIINLMRRESKNEWW